MRYHFCEFRTSSAINTDEWQIIIVVNELRWLSQGGDYELDECIVFLSLEAGEHHACQEREQARGVLSLPEVGLEFPHTACSLVIMLELHISLLRCFGCT